MIWKNIIGYEGQYQISDAGEVRSLDRIVNRSSQSDMLLKGQFISKRKTKQGYFQCMLSKKAKKTFFSVSRLVAFHFIPNPENKKQVNHINGIKTDNRVENLEWCTQSENQHHAYRTGLQHIALGEKRGMVCKLTSKDVILIKNKIKEGVRNHILSKEYKVSPVTISNIKTGAIWAHI